MAITVNVASLGTNGATAGGSIAFNTGSTAASDSLIVVAVAWFTASGVTLSSVSGGGLTWTTHVQGGPFNPKMAIASAPAASGLASGQTITATFSASATASAIGGSSLSGADLSGTRVDDTASAIADEGDAAWVCGTMDLAAGSAIVAAAYNESSVSGSTTTYTELVDAADGFSNGFTSVLRVVAGGGSGLTAGGTWSGAANAVVAGVAFKETTAFTAGGYGFTRLGRHRGRHPARGHNFF